MKTNNNKNGEIEEARLKAYTYGFRIRGIGILAGDQSFRCRKRNRDQNQTNNCEANRSNPPRSHEAGDGTYKVRNSRIQGTRARERL